MGAEVVGAVVSAVLGAVLGFWFKAHRDRKARRNEVRVEALFNAQVAQKHRAEKYRANPSRVVGGLRADRPKARIHVLVPNPDRTPDPD